MRHSLRQHLGTFCMNMLPARHLNGMSKEELHDSACSKPFPPAPFACACLLLQQPSHLDNFQHHSVGGTDVARGFISEHASRFSHSRTHQMHKQGFTQLLFSQICKATDSSASVRCRSSESVCHVPGPADEEDTASQQSEDTPARRSECEQIKRDLLMGHLLSLATQNSPSGLPSHALPALAASLSGKGLMPKWVQWSLTQQPALFNKAFERLFNEVCACVCWLCTLE